MRLTIIAVGFGLFWAFEASAQQRLFTETCPQSAGGDVICQVLCPTGREAIDGGAVAFENIPNEPSVHWPIMSGFDSSGGPSSGIATGWQATARQSPEGTQIGVWVVCGSVPTVATGPVSFLVTLIVGIVAATLWSFQRRRRPTPA